MFVRGEGTELWDVEGKRYLDFLSGIAVTSLGHANPVVDRGDRRPRRRSCCTSATSSPTRRRRAPPSRSTSCSPTPPARAAQVFFTNSGAEAIECAIKLARKFGGRGRHTVVSAFGSFHGRTLAALAATGQPTKHEPFQPMPEGFRHVAWGDLDALRRSGRRIGGRRAHRAGPGRGRREPGAARLPRRRSASCATRPGR